VRFTWRRVTRRVARAEGPERIAPEWWHLIGERAVAQDAASRDAVDDWGLGPVVRTPKPAWRVRDYYRIEDEYGGVYWIYRAGIYPNADPVTASGSTSDTEPEPDRDATRPASKATVADKVAEPAQALAPPTWYLQGVF